MAQAVPASLHVRSSERLKAKRSPVVVYHDAEKYSRRKRSYKLTEPLLELQNRKKKKLCLRPINQAEEKRASVLLAEETTLAILTSQKWTLSSLKYSTAPDDARKGSSKKLRLPVPEPAEMECLSAVILDGVLQKEQQQSDDPVPVICGTKRNAHVSDQESCSSSDASRKRRKRGVADCLAEDDVVCLPAVLELEKDPVLSLQDLPGQILKGLFQCCDLPTRCKVRRVKRWWRNLVSLPEVNEVVLVDNTCLYVSNFVRENPRRLCRGKRKPSERQRGVEMGFYDIRLRRKGCDARVDKFANLADHRRHGLLGPHVRVIVYDAARSGVCSVDSWMDNMRSIGLYCKGTEEIIFRNCVWTVRSVDREAFFEEEVLKSFPCLTCITVADSVVKFGVIATDEDVFCIRSPVSSLTIPVQGDKNVPLNFNHLIFPYPPEQRDWVAKFAPMLPPVYHEWCASGDVLAQEIQRDTTGVDSCDAYVLTTADYSLMAPTYLRALSLFIMKEKIPGSEPPPCYIQMEPSPHSLRTWYCS